MEIEFVASFAVITPDPATSRKLYLDALGLPLEGADGPRLHPHREHRRRQALRRLAARAGGGGLLRRQDWPEDTPVPQAASSSRSPSPEAVDAGGRRSCARPATSSCTRHARSRGARPSRGCSPEGLIVGISYAPWMHG